MTRNRPRRAQPRRDRPLRTSVTDPNVIERAALYLSLGDLLDRTPAQLATVKAARRHRKENDS